MRQRHTLTDKPFSVWIRTELQFGVTVRSHQKAPLILKPETDLLESVLGSLIARNELQKSMWHTSETIY